MEYGHAQGVSGCSCAGTVSCADRAVLTTAAVFKLALKRSQAGQVRLSFAVPAIVIMVPLFGRPEIARELYISGTTVKPT